MRLSLVCLLLGLPLLTFAQEPAATAPPPAEHKGGMPAPKNLKIIKPEEIRAVMGSFVTGLGVKCNFCHVQGDFASDDKPEKLTARKMLLMTRDINTHFQDATTDMVACYTCHRGATKPLTAPPPAAAGAPEGAPPPAH
jgi:Photosynthetic reaction centre cytochrome C subunit